MSKLLTLEKLQAELAEVDKHIAQAAGRTSYSASGVSITWDLAELNRRKRNLESRIAAISGHFDGISI